MTNKTSCWLKAIKHLSNSNLHTLWQQVANSSNSYYGYDKFKTKISCVKHRVIIRYGSEVSSAEENRKVTTTRQRRIWYDCSNRLAVSTSDYVIYRRRKRTVSDRRPHLVPDTGLTTSCWLSPSQLLVYCLHTPRACNTLDIPTNQRQMSYISWDRNNKPIGAQNKL